MKPTFNPTFQAYVDQILYDFKEQSGIVWLSMGRTVDMDGAIYFFSQIDPYVRTIIVYSGNYLVAIRHRENVRTGWVEKRQIPNLRIAWH